METKLEVIGAGPSPDESQSGTASPEDIGKDPFEQAASWGCASTRSAFEAAREALEQAELAAMGLVPPEVTRHLVNAQQELIRAGMRVANVAGSSAERWGNRAIEVLESKAKKAAEVRGNRNDSTPK